MANLYIESIDGLLSARPKNNPATQDFVTELEIDIVEPLQARAAELSAALNELEQKHNLLVDAVAAEEVAEEELKARRKELLARARREKAKAARVLIRSDSSNDDDQVDVDDHVDEREHEQLEAHLVPAAEEERKATKVSREEAVDAVKQALANVLVTLKSFDER